MNLTHCQYATPIVQVFSGTSLSKSKISTNNVPRDNICHFRSVSTNTILSDEIVSVSGTPSLQSTPFCAQVDEAWQRPKVKFGQKFDTEVGLASKAQNVGTS